MSAARRVPQRGVSLIEALVALAVMAFGVLGVVGLQATLRNNADVSRQRGEAVRFAQARIEAKRAYSSVASAGGAGYADILSAPGEALPTTIENTAYTLYQTATDLPNGRAKTLRVRVEWRDRTSETDSQSVEFGTIVARVPPELPGSLALAGSATAMATPKSRHPAIPVSAVPIANTGQSEFTLPGVALRFIFDNLTGDIVNVCNPDCPVVPVGAHLLSGYVRYATGSAGQPTPADAELPPGPSPTVPTAADALPPSATGQYGYVSVLRTGATEADLCLHQLVASSAWVAYYCAVPFTMPARTWSGVASVNPSNVATSPTEASPSRVRVCRYAPVENPTRNADHPARYTDVGGPLTNQNFLVIDAGNGTTAYTCPGDGPGPANTATWLHQPTPP